MADTEAEVGNGLGLAGMAGQGLEGYWRGGLTAPTPVIKDGVQIGTRRIADAEMLERFAGVSGGGEVGRVPGAPNGGGVNALGVLGTAGSLYGLYSGTKDMVDSEKSTTERVLGGGNALTGLIGSVGGIANMANVGMTTGTGMLAGAQNFLAGMTSLGGAGIGGGGLAGNVGAASTWFGTEAAGAGLGTAAGAGAAATTGAAVLGSALGGIGIGMYGDEHMREITGGRSISDMGADAGVAVDEAVTGFIGGEQGSLRRAIGGGLGTAAGLNTVGVASLLGVPAAIGSALHGAGSAVVNGVSSLFGTGSGS